MTERAFALAVNDSPQAQRMARLQRLRRALQIGFFALFLLAPALDLLRFDLNEAQLWVLGHRWSLGIDEFTQHRIDATQVALNIVLRAILPGVLLVVAFMTVAYRYGRLYCGWLCPHFSLVESLNALLQRASGKLSFWDRQRTLSAGQQPDRRWWPAFFLSCAIFGFLWAITLLSYLLPPREIWGNLAGGTLTPNQGRFIAIGSVVFTLEFMFARHLFCRSCSTASSPQGSACDSACPMRLNPRNIKRMMFSCVQCGQCLTECESSHDAQGRSPNLEWKVGLDAVRETLRQRREDRG